MDFTKAVQGFVDSTQQGPQVFSSAFLLPVADYSRPLSLSGLTTATAGKLPAALRQLHLVQGRLIDEKELAWVFQTDGWTRTRESIDELRAAMPKGVVSAKADRVAVWKRMERALERQPSRVAAYDSRAFFIIEGSDVYLVLIDFKNRRYASSCPEYSIGDEKKRRRFEICKHLIAAFTYYRTEVFKQSGIQPTEIGEWELSFQRCQSMSEALKSNWFYFFLKFFVPKMGFTASYFKEPSRVNSVISFLSNQK